jgi:uncharacterized protein YtpQ (UPF0354 family)
MKLQLKKFNNQNKKNNIVHIKHYIHNKIYYARRLTSIYLLITLNLLKKKNTSIRDNSQVKIFLLFSVDHRFYFLYFSYIQFFLSKQTTKHNK